MKLQIPGDSGCPHSLSHLLFWPSQTHLLVAQLCWGGERIFSVYPLPLPGSLTIKCSFPMSCSVDLEAWPPSLMTLSFKALSFTQPSNRSWPLCSYLVSSAFISWPQQVPLPSCESRKALVGLVPHFLNLHSKHSFRCPACRIVRPVYMSTQCLPPSTWLCPSPLSGMCDTHIWFVIPI